MVKKSTKEFEGKLCAGLYTTTTVLNMKECGINKLFCIELTRICARLVNTLFLIFLVGLDRRKYYVILNRHVTFIAKLLSSPVFEDKPQNHFQLSFKALDGNTI